jgi:hypothetical protein
MFVKDWAWWEQAAAIGALGVLQYGALGHVVGRSW